MGFFYRRDDSYFSKSGYYWWLECDEGVVTAYDKHDTAARNYATAFKNNVDRMNNYFAKFEIEVGAGIITTGMAMAPLTGGISGIVAAFAALGITILGSSSIISAYNEAMAANDNFLNFKARTSLIS